MAQGAARSIVLGVRVTPDELRALRIAAARRDLRPPEYVRALVLPIAWREAA